MLDLCGPSRLLGPGLSLGDVTTGLVIALLLSFGFGIGVGFLLGSASDRPPSRGQHPDDGYRRLALARQRRRERPGARRSTHL